MHSYEILLLLFLSIQMIHDFVCCENAGSSGHALTLAGLLTPTGTILVGPTFMCVSSQDFFSSADYQNLDSITSAISCKSSLSLLDLYTFEGRAAATSLYRVSRDAALLSSCCDPRFSWPDVVLMETCLVR
jgi:hypothetical protein